MYEQESTVSQSESIPLVVEVVSTNWSDDYALKFDEYETIGIPEYLIVDYLGLVVENLLVIPNNLLSLSAT